MLRRGYLLLGCGILPFCHATNASAQPKQITWKVRAVADTMSVVAGGERKGTRVSLESDAIVEADLGAWLDVKDLTISGQVLAAASSRPNDLAGTLQGVDNIEVAKSTVKLLQMWVSKGIGDRASVLAGLVDLNIDFYQNASAGLLLAPAFGIGSELAAAGPNGPSIFPSTALTLRLDRRIGAEGYARAAVVNAQGGVLGLANEFHRMTRDGVLLIGEAGVTARGKIALGLWRYSRRQPDIRIGSKVRAVAQGAYLLAEHRVIGGGESERSLDVFARAGLSEGRTTAFKGGYQIGMLASGMIRARPDAAISIGVNGGFLSRGLRGNLDAVVHKADAEHAVELTFRDRLMRYVWVQPDVQYVRRAFAIEGKRGIWLIGLRLAVEI